MASFEDSISRKRDQIVRERQSYPYRVAVLGPGETHATFFKRRQILESLKDEDFNAFFPEDIVDLNSPMSVLEQERLILRGPDVDWIIVLDSSEGPLAELAAYAQEPAIVIKTFVLCPEDYYTPKESYPTDILEQYNNRWRFTKEELERCDIVHECMTRARIGRLQAWPKLRSKSF